MISIFCINYFSTLAMRNEKKQTAFGNFYRSRVLICRNAHMFFNANAEKKVKCIQSNNKCISAAALIRVIGKSRLKRKKQTSF